MEFLNIVLVDLPLSKKILHCKLVNWLVAMLLNLVKLLMSNLFVYFALQNPKFLDKYIFKKRNKIYSHLTGLMDRLILAFESSFLEQDLLKPVSLLSVSNLIALIKFQLVLKNYWFMKIRYSWLKKFFSRFFSIQLFSRRRTTQALNWWI